MISLRALTMLSSTQDDLIDQFQGHNTAKELYEALRSALASETATRLHQLQLNFEFTGKWI